MDRWIVVIGSLVHSTDTDLIQTFKNGLMVIDDSRRIVCVEELSKPEDLTIDLLRSRLKKLWQIGSSKTITLCHSVNLIRLRTGEFFIPGFIDTHTHAVQYNNIGIGQQYQLLDWLKNVTFSEEMRFESDRYAERTFERVVKRLISVGTTTACYYGSIHLKASKILAQVCHRAGQRAFIGKCNMDRNDALEDYKENSAKESIEDTIKLINYVRQEFSSHQSKSSDRFVQTSFGSMIVKREDDCSVSEASSTIVQPILTPRFAISCSSELLDGLGQLMRSDPTLRLQTHLSESRQEIMITKELFKDHSSYGSIYDRFGLLTPTTILAHCIHLEPEELELIKLRGSGLSHCPTSNFNLSSGVCQVKEILDSGISKVGLGTDVSGGYGIGILTSIRDGFIASKALRFQDQQQQQQQQQQNNISRGEDRDGVEQQAFRETLTVENLFYMASLGGSRVCGLEGLVGNFEVGKRFDGLLIQTGINPQESDPSRSTLEKIERENQEEEDDDDDDDDERWFERYCSERYEDGCNPNFFVEEEGGRELSLLELLEKFLFTGDDRNIGSVFIDSVVVGGARPIKLKFS
ncbi:hypothetical protein BY996DRAFT_4580651 [Phakopsora pachyrhizi]|nr:hypothetical protein BY996DRAFT_4580651 [Phakopsora pachyrhizi]